MNIKQALKRKNKLVVLISEEYQRVNTYNSVEEGNTRPYSPTESLENWKNYINELIDLKTKIHSANKPMYEKIFRLSELKTMAKHLRNLNCNEGKERNRWADKNEPIIRTSEISLLQRDTMIKEVESEIELIQDELDRFNAVTEI